MYLTEIIGTPVLDSAGERVGKIADLFVTLGEPFPEVSAILVRETKRVIPWRLVKEINDEWRLSVRRDEVKEYTPAEKDVRLARDILDKQIVDIHGARIVRVNDLNLVMAHGVLRLIGVDATTRGLLRRVGLEKLADAIARRLGLRLHTHLISWADVEQVPEAVDRLKLRVPTDRLSRLHHADIADIVAQMRPDERREVFESLDLQTAADTLEEMEPEVQRSVLEELEPERAADIVEEMEPDEAADLLADLPEERREELLDEMEPEEAADVMDLMSYDEASAGGIMTTEFVTLPQDMTAQQAIDYLRKLAPSDEMVYYLYVVDDENRLVGVLSLRQLIVAQPDTPIRDIMERDVIRVHVGSSLEEVARDITKYDLLAIPVVDEDDHIRGVVTVDDVMDFIVPPTYSSRPPRIFRKR